MSDDLRPGLLLAVEQFKLRMEHQGETGKWIITYWKKPIPSRKFDWDYVHDEYTGDEDNRFGSASSPAECLEQIAEIEGVEDADHE